MCVCVHPSDALTYEFDLSVVFDVIEGGVDSGGLSVENSKLAAVGLPCKSYDAFCKGKSICQFFFFLP